MMLSRPGRWLLAGLIALAVCSPALPAVPEYDLKAALLYKFTKFILWPNSAFSGPHGTLHLCVIGHDDFGGSIESLNGQKVQGQAIEIERLPEIKRSPAGTLTHCQIAFIGRSERERLPVIIEALSATPALTVSDIDGFAGAGGMIGFVNVDSKIGFEINPAASRRAGIEIGAQLLQLSTVINEPRTEGRP